MLMRARVAVAGGILVAAFATSVPSTAGHREKGDPRTGSGRHFFERETFDGNGRTCSTCHSARTGTVSPADAQRRFADDPGDPLFLADGSDDGQGNGVSRMLADATILVRVPLAPNVTLADDPSAWFVTLRRGIPSTINTPALDPVLMYDGRQPDLRSQADGAIADHAEAQRPPTALELQRIADFQQTRRFFSSNALWQLAKHGRLPDLPEGKSDAERRGRTFFEDAPFTGDSKPGICAICHSGPMLNATNEFIPAPLPRSRFQNVFVSDFNAPVNPVRTFVFQNPDGTVRRVRSPDPGRALITGKPRGLDNVNAFKIPSLWNVARTAPYFHDNSAKSLEDVMKHYAQYFAIVTDPSQDGNPPVIITEEDQADIIAFLKLLR